LATRAKSIFTPVRREGAPAAAQRLISADHRMHSETSS
jgi:hypothetical protein